MFAHFIPALVLLSLPSTSLANPVAVTLLNPSTPRRYSWLLTARAVPDPSDYPYGDPYPNEFKYANWDSDNEVQKAQAKKIHNAFGEWREMAAAALKEASNTDDATYKRWFGEQDDKDDQKRVFANMWDSDNDQAGRAVADVTCDYEDFSNACGSSTRAYTLRESGRFHVCDPGLQSDLNSNINCDDLDDSCSAKMRSLPMTLLHEMCHFNRIGEEARGGFSIDEDIAAGAYDCTKLGDTPKGDNAQNYVWFAGEAYWGGKCGMEFSDPGEGVKAVGEDESPPSLSGPGSPQCYGDGRTAFHQPAATHAIDDFCTDPGWKDKVIVPLVTYGNGKTSSGAPNKVLGIDNEGTPANAASSALWMGVSFAEFSIGGYITFDSEKCKANLGAILNGCDATGPFPKHGGWLQDVGAIYRLFATVPEAPNPIYTQAASGNMGSWTCKPTNITYLEGAGLGDTYTCLYSKQTSVTDIFVKPDGGCPAIDEGTNPMVNP